MFAFDGSWGHEVAKRRDHYLYYSGHGDLAATADTAGTPTASETYDPFGAPLVTQPANSTQHLFAGQWDKQYDTSSGLILMGARPYEPSLGRFLAVDPVDGGSLNNYDYAGQDPLNKLDLDGLMIASDGGGDCPYDGLGGLRGYDLNGQCLQPPDLPPAGPVTSGGPGNGGGTHGGKGGHCDFLCKVATVAAAVYGTADVFVIGGATVAVGTICFGATGISGGLLFLACGPPTAAGIAATALVGYKNYLEWKKAWDKTFGSKSQRKRN